MSRRETPRVELKQAQYRGALLGLAVGDALGAPLKFREKGSQAAVHEMISGGALNTQAGEWTDDTSTALCLAASMIERADFDPLDQMRRYNKWRREGYLSSTGQCFDISTTMKVALDKFESTQEPFCGETGRESADNDAISRLAAIPMFYAQNPQEAIDQAVESARTTHAAKEATDACAYMSGLICGILRGERNKERLLADMYSPFEDDWGDYNFCDEVAEIAAGSFRKDKPTDISGSGFAPETLEAALWAFYRSNSFETGAILAVNLGGDSDSTGAVYGQIAGAYYGVSAIPEKWRNKVVKRDIILGLADRLWALAQKR